MATKSYTSGTACISKYSCSLRSDTCSSPEQERRPPRSRDPRAASGLPSCVASRPYSYAIIHQNASRLPVLCSVQRSSTTTSSHIRNTNRSRHKYITVHTIDRPSVTVSVLQQVCKTIQYHFEYHPGHAMMDEASCVKQKPCAAPAAPAQARCAAQLRRRRASRCQATSHRSPCAVQRPSDRGPPWAC